MKCTIIKNKLNRHKYCKKLLNCVSHIFKIYTLLLLLPLSIFSQEKQNTLTSKTERYNYVQEEDTLINFKFSFYNLDQEFNISGNDFNFNIKPNFTLKTRFFFNYRFISVAIAVAPDFIPGNKDNDIKGKTKSFTFNLNFYMKHWAQEFQFNNTKGFYIGNIPNPDIPDWIEGEDPYIQLPEMILITYRGTTSYILNSNFSIKAVRAQTEIQKKSAGSFIPSLMYNYFIIDNSGEKDWQSYQNSYNFEGLVSLWYMHTFVIHKNWYITGGIAPAIGYNFSKLETYFRDSQYTTHYREPIFRLNEQINIGTNIKRFFAGIQLFASQTKEYLGDNTVKQNNYYTTFHVFAGYRFNVPKILKKH